MSTSFHKGFCEAVAVAFDLPALTRLVKFRLNVDLADKVLVADAFDNIVNALVGWAERQGRLTEPVVAVTEGVKA